MDFRKIMSNPTNEYRRLAEVYAAMADRELEALARDADQLTEIAQEILAKELRRRGIDIPFENVVRPTEKEMTTGREMPTEFPELVSICRFDNKTEAILARGLIESCGIECFLSDDRIGVASNAIHHYYRGPLREIDLQVKPEDADAAREILQHSILEEPEIEP